MFWTELRFMARLGITPLLTRCPSCREPISEDMVTTGFSCSRGGILCTSCARREHRPMHTTRFDALKALAYWQACDNLPSPLATTLGPADYRDIQKILGSFMQHHLDMPLYSREIAIRLLLSNSSVGAERG